MKPSTFIFDLGGVLINLNMPRCVQTFNALLGESTAQQLLGTGSSQDILAKLSIAHNRLLRDYEQGRISSDDFLAALQQLCGRDITAEQVREAWMSMLDELPQARLDFIQSLREKGCRTYLLSNTNEEHWEYIADLYHLPNYFDQLFVSHEMHLSKPDKAIFDQVAQAIQSDPRITCYIDDLAPNREAAERFVGWHTFPDIETLKKYLE